MGQKQQLGDGVFSMRVSDDHLVLQRIRTMQIIAGALLAGQVILLAVALYLVLMENEGQGLAPESAPIISLTAILLLAINAPLAFILPRSITQAGLRQIAAGSSPTAAEEPELATGTFRLLGLRQTTLVIALALLEGAGFTGSIAYLLEGQTLALLVSAGAILGTLVLFPTAGGVRDWLGRQEQRLKELRSGMQA